MTGEPDWLQLGRELAAIAQNGLTYATDPHDRTRFTQVRDVAARLLAGGDGFQPEAVRELLAVERGYATPKVDVRGVVFDGSGVLLVREREDGRWTLPGGWADVNETPAQAVEREVAEESGYLVQATKLLAVYDRACQGHRPLLPFSVYKLFFACDIVGGDPTAGDETDGVAFFTADALPELSAGRTTSAQLRRFFASREDPAAPTDFD